QMTANLSSVHGRLIRPGYALARMAGGGFRPRDGRAGVGLPPDQEDVMRRLIGWLGVAAVTGLGLAATAARADDKKVPLDKVPKAVMDAIKARFPGAEITSVEKEKEGDKVVYDIELKHQGRKYEMDIQEDGTILEVEKEVATKDVPEAVTKA